MIFVQPDPQVSLAAVLRTRFWVAQSGCLFWWTDAEIVFFRVGAIPNSAKATTDESIRVWNEWAASRATTKDKYTCSYCSVIHA